MYIFSLSRSLAPKPQLPSKISHDDYRAQNARRKRKNTHGRVYNINRFRINFRPHYLTAYALHLNLNLYIADCEVYYVCVYIYE